VTHCTGRFHLAGARRISDEREREYRSHAVGYVLCLPARSPLTRGNPRRTSFTAHSQPPNIVAVMSRRTYDSMIPLRSGRFDRWRPIAASVRLRLPGAGYQGHDRLLVLLGRCRLCAAARRAIWSWAGRTPRPKRPTEHNRAQNIDSTGSASADPPSLKVGSMRPSLKDTARAAGGTQ
jgi:hypothetical protein